MHDICQQDVEPDGLTFDVDSLTGEVIKEEADYSGVRIKFLGLLQNARIAMQIDIGFGDVVVPDADMTDYPTILELAGPRLWTYPRETVVSEKYEAMVKLGQLNSRMKDFFDLWILSRQFAFDGPSLAMAVSRTFANRQTPLNPNPVAFTTDFVSDSTKQTQWRGFLRKSKLGIAPADLAEAISSIREFLLPLTDALTSGKPFDMEWKPLGPWIQRS